ncbi:MAG: hypothetical protein LBT80_08995 [Lactobacillaceae bacterium]|jgi:sortase (surface protein transpeptidase)|nr:hypothetical protein [Lactobacillaceae bacterium]
MRISKIVWVGLAFLLIGMLVVMFFFQTSDGITAQQTAVVEHTSTQQKHTSASKVASKQLTKQVIEGTPNDSATSSSNQANLWNK